MDLTLQIRSGSEPRHCKKLMPPSSVSGGWTKPLRGRFKPIIDHASIFAKDFLIDDVWTIARVRECKLPLTLGVPQ
jgi:hypothetical protein